MSVIGSVIPPTMSVTGSVIPPTMSVIGSVIPPTMSVTGSVMPPTMSVTGSVIPPTMSVIGSVITSTMSAIGLLTGVKSRSGNDPIKEEMLSKFESRFSKLPNCGLFATSIEPIKSVNVFETDPASSKMDTPRSVLDKPSCEAIWP